MEEWQKPETIALWIVIAILFLMLLLIVIVQLVRTIYKRMLATQIKEAETKLTHQQNLLNATIQTQEKERQRIAADLHDTLIGQLTAIKMQHELDPENESLQKKLTESIAVARRISHDLSPPMLEYTPLADLIEEVVSPWEVYASIDAKYDVQIEMDHSNDFKIQLTRIIQEVITNIVKHADASVIHIHYRQSKNWIALKIADNGKGFDTGQDGYKGLGLKNIETRVQYLNGQYRVRSKINEGTSFMFLFFKNK